MTDAVADAGPLIHLDEVKAGRALDVFTLVRVPDAVAAELTARPHRPGASLLRRRNVKRVALSTSEITRAAHFRRAMGLSIADASALALAQAHASVFLTDDLDLRDAAAAVDVRPVGTIGVLIRAAATGVISKQEAAASLDALLETSSLFLTRRLWERARDALGDL